MVKHVFSMPLSALKGLIDSIFRLSPCTIKLPHQSCKLRPHLRLKRE